MFNTCTYLTTLKFYIKFRQVPEHFQTLPINFYEKPNVLPWSMNILVKPIYVADTELLTCITFPENEIQFRSIRIYPNVKRTPPAKEIRKIQQKLKHVAMSIWHVEVLRICRRWLPLKKYISSFKWSPIIPSDKLLFWHTREI